MSDFVSKPNSVTAAPPDARKHVNYTLGMVLGVDDFTQEFAYLAGRDQWMMRDLIGYGTVCGLQVKIEYEADSPRILVAPGVALSPRGQLIRVTSAQCARLNEWLAAYKASVIEQLGSPAGKEITLYVTLCYRDCPVDNVPIPGEPCRTAEESMAPSRLIDDFRLELHFSPPDQREEDAVRDFVAWLSQIEISDAPGSASLEEFVAALRDAVIPITSPLGAPLDFMLGSPLAALHIHPADTCAFWRAAFRIWVTELRPRWSGSPCAATGGGCGDPGDEACLLLAELRVPLTQSLNGDPRVAATWDRRVDEERRPYVVHLRLLQEWLLCGPHTSTTLGSPLGPGVSITPANSVTDETTFGPPFMFADPGTSLEYSRGDHTHGTPPLPGVGGDVTGSIDNMTVEKLRGVELIDTPPEPNQVLRLIAGKWTPVDLPLGVAPPGPADSVKLERTFGESENAGSTATTTYSRSDHTHGTPDDPIPGHLNVVNAHILSGDVNGLSGQLNKVAGIQGVPVAPDTPLSDQVLRFDAVTGQWTPATLPAAPVTGSFVQHPAALEAYAIVAAGIVKGDGPGRLPLYNNLTAKIMTDGELLVHFDQYKKPSQEFQYIVKALVVFDAETRQQLRIEGKSIPPIVTFDRFESDSLGFVLFISLDNAPMKQDQLKLLELMIEVSQYPF